MINQLNKSHLDRIKDYVITFRRGGAFTDYTEDQIERELEYCERTKHLFVGTNTKDEIVGVCTYDVFDVTNTVFVFNVLSERKEFFFLFCKFLAECFPRCLVTFHHHGKLKLYAPEQNVQILKKLYGRTNSNRLPSKDSGTAKSISYEFA